RDVTAGDARTGKEQSMDVKPSYGLTDEQVEAMIEASIDHAEEDYSAAQVAGARVDADGILAAVDKAKRDAAWLDLTDQERSKVTDAINRLQLVYHSNDHELIRKQIDVLNDVTHSLAEDRKSTRL